MRLPYWRVTWSKLTIEAWGCVTCLLLMVRSASATRVLGSGELGIGRQGGSGATGGGHRGDRAVDTHPQDPVLGWDRRDGEAADQGEGATDTRRTSAGRREPADPGMSGEVAWGRWRLAWHGFFYLLVAYATATAIADASPSAAGVAARLALVGALGGWYAWWMIARPAARAEVIYLVGAVALWAWWWRPDCCGSSPTSRVASRGRRSWRSLSSPPGRCCRSATSARSCGRAGSASGCWSSSRRPVRSWPPRSAGPACSRSGSGWPATSTTPSARALPAWCCCWRPPRNRLPPASRWIGTSPRRCGRPATIWPSPGGWSGRCVLALSRSSPCSGHWKS